MASAELDNSGPSRNVFVAVLSMTMLPMRMLSLWALLGCLTFSTLPAEESGPAVELPPFSVEASYADIRLGVRFRYNLPGAALKALTIKKAPQSWREQGVKPGDWLVAVDGEPIDGKGLRETVQMIDRRTGKPMRLEFQSKQTKTRFTITVLFRKDSGDITITYP